MYKNIRFFLASFVVLIVIIAAVMINPSFSNAKSQSEVKWGCATQEPVVDINFGCPNNVDLVTGPWVLNDFNNNHINWLNNFLDSSNQLKTPYINTYVIAGMARQEWGLQDCNIDPINNLCQKGATYLQLYEDEIVTRYTAIANGIKDNLTTSNLYVHIEPDYFQYNSSSQEWPLQKEDAWRIMNRITNVFKSTVPQAKLVLDISPWNYDLDSWCGGFDNFDYGGVVGKWFDANQAPDGQSYDKLSGDCGYELVINTAHGPGGYFNGYNSSWEGKNHNAHAIIQSPLESSRYGDYLASIKGGGNFDASLDPKPVSTLPTNQTSAPNTGGQQPAGVAEQLVSANTEQVIPEADAAQVENSAEQDAEIETSQEFVYPSTGVININGQDYYSNEQVDAAIKTLKPIE